MSHPITPPPELVKQLAAEARTWLDATTDAYRAGADAELEACCEWLKSGPYGFSIAASAPSLIVDLRTARRPKPPSLAEQALAALNEIEDRYSGPSTEEILVRRALERLQELEQSND